MKSENHRGNERTEERKVNFFQTNSLAQQQEDQKPDISRVAYQMNTGISKLNTISVLPTDSMAQSVPTPTSNSRLAYPSNDIHYQPRAGLQQNQAYGTDIPLQIPSNQMYFTTPNFSSNEQIQNPNYYSVPSNQIQGIGVNNNLNFQFGTPGASTPNILPSSQVKEQLPQLNFPINSTTTAQSSTYSTPGTSNSLNSSTSYFPNFSQGYSPSLEPPYQPNRSHSYGNNVYHLNNRSLNSWGHDLQYPFQNQLQPQEFQLQQMEGHKSENFTEEDVRVLKSLLFNGERMKWRYISSKLSSVSGRRATASACSKKTRELFKLPSEKASGSLGTSLPYVVHNSWNEIVEQD